MAENKTRVFKNSVIPKQNFLPVICLRNRRPLKIKGSEWYKLVLNDQGNQSNSFEINLDHSEPSGLPFVCTNNSCKVQVVLFLKKLSKRQKGVSFFNYYGLLTIS